MRWIPLTLWALACGGPSSSSSPVAPSTSTTATPSMPDTAVPSPSPTDTTDTAAPLDLTWSFDDRTPTLAHLRWAPRPGVLALAWSDAAGAHTLDLDATAGAAVLPGLPAGSPVTWAVTLMGPQEEATASGATEVPAPPDDLHPFVPTVHASGGEAEGLWFLTVAFDFGPDPSSYAVVVDGEGRIRWWRAAEPEQRILRAHLAADGAAVLWASNDSDQSEEAGVLVRDPIDGGPPVVTVAPAFHHDFLEEDDGYVFLAYRYTEIDFGVGPQPTAVDVVRRVEEGATGGFTDVFDFEADWPSAPRLACSHATLGAFVPGHYEWTHSNSLVAAADGDGWWVLARYLDQLGRVDGSGQVLGVVGGDDPTWPTADGALPLVHGHFSQVSERGTLWVFSNGDHVHQASGSEVVELAVDPEAGTTTVLRRLPGPEERFTAFLGDVRELEGGHLLVVNPNLGLFEYGPDGEVLWELRHDGPREIGRVVPLAPWVD